MLMVAHIALEGFNLNRRRSIDSEQDLRKEPARTHRRRVTLALASRRFCSHGTVV